MSLIFVMEELCYGWITFSELFWPSRYAIPKGLGWILRISPKNGISLMILPVLIIHRLFIKYCLLIIKISSSVIKYNYLQFNSFNKDNKR